MTTTPPTPTLPMPPAALSSTVGDNVIHLAWGYPRNDGGSPITNYIVYRGLSALALTEYANVPPTLPFTFFDDTNVVDGTEYFYRIQSVNAVGPSPRLGPELWTQPVKP